MRATHLPIGNCLLIVAGACVLAGCASFGPSEGATFGTPATPRSTPTTANTPHVRPPRVPSTASQEDQVLNLIERLIDAHDTGLLEDKQAAGEILGFRYQGNEVHTGIALLDDFSPPIAGVLRPSPPNVRYRIRKSDEGFYYYYLDFDQFGHLICISPKTISNLMKRPFNENYPTPHGQRNFGGAYGYRTWTKNGDRYAFFAYIYRSDAGTCLDDVRFQKRLPL